MRWKPSRSIVIAVPIAALLAATQFCSVNLASSAPAAAIRIMPLGDSITGNPGCWRAYLWQKLQTGGYSNIDMVGTQPAQGCGFTHDGDNEGHGGELVTTVADQNKLPGWLSATTPDIVVMHFGTNDVWSNRSTDQILAAYGKLVDQMRASKPSMKIIVAQIIPVAPTGQCPECPQRTMNLNGAIPAWAKAKSTAQSPIAVVDQWTGWSAANDTGDGVHPTDAGHKKMAEKWYPAVAAALSGTTPGTPSETPSTTPASSGSSASTPSETPSTTPGSSGSSASAPVSPSSPANPGATCSATVRVVNQWSGGFQGEVAVRNTGAGAVARWSASFTFADGQAITQAWNGTVRQTGGTVTISNISWNGALATGTSTSAGFIATWNDNTNSTPIASCTAA